MLCAGHTAGGPQAMRRERQAERPLGQKGATAGSRLLQAQPARSYAALAQRHLALAAAHQQVRFLHYASDCHMCLATTSAAIIALSIALVRSDMPEDPMHDHSVPEKMPGLGPLSFCGGMLSG